MNLYVKAKEYIEKGLHILPTGNDKKPVVKTWKPFEKRFPTEEELQDWFIRNDFNIAIITGKCSGITVIDIDGVINEKFDSSLTVKTKKGQHLYFKYTDKVKNAVRIKDNIDIRNDNGYVIAPGSVINGHEYTWIDSRSFQRELLIDFPVEKFEKLNSETEKINWDEFSKTMVYQGARNGAAIQYAGHLLSTLAENEWESVGWTEFKSWNSEYNQPPEEEKKLRTTWESIKKSEESKRATENKEKQASTNKPQSDLLVEIIEQRISNNEIVLFKNNLQEPYIRIQVDDHKEIWSCKSKMFKHWLAKCFWDKEGRTPNSDALTQALNVIEGKSLFEGKIYNLHNRVTWDEEGNIWYDLSDTKFRAVKISSNRWEIVEPPIFFKRYFHQQPQVEPCKDSDIKRFLKFLNIKDKDKKQEILILVYLVSCFIPDFPHPILNVYGAQGAAKSTLLRLLKKLIDPSAIEVTSLKADNGEFIQLLAHHYFIPFDNVSHLGDSCSDTLCRAVSGDGYSKRVLFTDDDDIIYTFKRCLGINGINLVATKPDLLERSILFEVERVPEDKRKEEQELFHEFEIDRPKILGGIFDAVSKALTIKPMIKLSNIPRMADFTKWGCAIAEALGYTKEEFLDAYLGNIATQNDEVLNESLLAQVLIPFIEERKIWEGSASKLKKELEEKANQLNVDTKEKGWAKAANTLSRQLNNLKTNLEGIGITFKRVGRILYIQKASKNIDNIDNINSVNNTVNRLHGKPINPEKLINKTEPQENIKSFNRNRKF